MTKNRRDKRSQQLGEVRQKTINAAATRTRIHAIVGQVIDELEKRRAKGKSDWVASLADEVEKGGLTAWKALRDLLPRDEPENSGATNVQVGSLFAIVAAQVGARDRLQGQSGQAVAPSEKMIDVSPTRLEEVIETTNVEEEDDSRGAVTEW
jgi:hypothetical protein